MWLLTLAVLFCAGLAALFLLERAMVYPFDPTEVAPADLGLQNVRVIRFTKGGRNLVIWSTPASPGKPTIFYLHGNAGNLANRAAHFREFADMGYGIVAPAYRGSSGSTGWPHQRALVADAAAIYADLLSGDLTGHPVKPVLYGESLGTAVTTHLNAQLAPENHPKAIVLEAPLTSIGDVAQNVRPGLRILTKIMPSPWHSVRKATQITVPLLVIHGTEDPLIPIALGRAVFDAAPSEDKHFQQSVGAGHSDAIRGEALTALIAFLNRV